MLQKLLTVISVCGLGFLFLNLAFMTDYAFQMFLMWIISSVADVDMLVQTSALPAVLHIAFLILLAVASSSILRSRVNTVVKAAWLMVPIAAVYLTIGMFTVTYPVIGIIGGILAGAGMLYGIRRYGNHWSYYVSWFAIGAGMLIGAILGLDV